MYFPLSKDSARPQKEDFGEEYFSSGAAYQEYEKYVGGWVNKVARKISRLVADVPAPSVLDIGCAHGYLIAELKSRYGMHVRGVEYSSYAYRNRLRAVHSEVARGDILTARLPARSFDVVICFDVLEYLTEAQNKRAAERLVRWSRKYILFTNPYRHSVNASQKQNPDPQRITAFSKKEYRALFHAVGVVYCGHFDGWHGGDILIFRKK